MMHLSQKFNELSIKQSKVITEKDNKSITENANAPSNMFEVIGGGIEIRAMSGVDSTIRASSVADDGSQMPNVDQIPNDFLVVHQQQ